MKVLIAGCGYVGTALGERLVERGYEVWGLRRDPSGLPQVFHKFAADLASPSDLAALPRDLDYIVYSASAGEASDAAYRQAYVLGLENLLSAVQGCPLRRFFFTSSTAVYAQADGSWVDEASATEPKHFSGQRTLEAENLLLGSGVPYTVLRCAGIYGPGRTRLVESVRQGQAAASDRFTNRIHRDDIAGAILHLMDGALATQLLILSDDEPAPQRDVVNYLAERLGVPKPAPGKSEPPERGGHKRCCNQSLRASGYRLKYPTYREGYAAMLANNPTG